MVNGAKRLISLGHLEAKDADAVDDEVFPGRSDSRQHGSHVVGPQQEEEQEAQQVAPHVHRLIGQDEEAGRKINIRQDVELENAFSAENAVRSVVQNEV